MKFEIKMFKVVRGMRSNGVDFHPFFSTSYAFSTKGTSDNKTKNKFEKDFKDFRPTQTDKLDLEKEPLEEWKDGVNPHTGEIGGPKGVEPTRYGDWERKGRVTDF